MFLLTHRRSGEKVAALIALVFPGFCLEYRMLTSRADARFHQDTIKKKCWNGLLLVDLRKCEGKAASLSRASALHADIAIHSLSQRLGDRQTDAGAAKGART